MKKYFIVLVIVSYLITYFYLAERNLILNLIKNHEIELEEKSIDVILYDFKPDEKEHKSIIDIFKSKGYNNVSLFCGDKIYDLEKSNYSIEIIGSKTVINSSLIGIYEKPKIDKHL